MARHEPERTCVGCRQRSARTALVRISAVGPNPRVDTSGRAGGRGAYVHPGCAGTAIARGALARALRTRLEPEEAATLREQIEQRGAG